MSFQPSADDLDYPGKLERQQQQAADGIPAADGDAAPAELEQQEQRPLIVDNGDTSSSGEDAMVGLLCLCQFPTSFCLVGLGAFSLHMFSGLCCWLDLAAGAPHQPARLWYIPFALTCWALQCLTSITGQG